MENKQKALEMVATMQQKEESGSLLWCVAEDLKNTINGMNEDEARVVVTDFEAGTHDLKTCEKAIHDYANKHKSGGSACCPGPAVPGILRLHYEIMAAAQAAAASLLDLARKIKLMRDTGGYKALGFDTLEAYTLTTMGMKQRQAYNYIAIAEKLPAQLIEQNAAAGVTKLALLAQLSGQEQQQITAETNLTETTVAELKAQIKELQAKNAGYAEQLSLLQNQPPVAEVQAEEVDMDALRAEIHAEMKAEMESQRRADAKMTELNQKERDEAIKAARKARAELEEAKRAAAAAEQARAKELDQARHQAEETAARLNMVADESAVRFGLLFDQLQDTAGKIFDLVDTLQQGGLTEKAEKFQTALHKALLALADEAEDVQK